MFKFAVIMALVNLMLNLPAWAQVENDDEVIHIDTTLVEVWANITKNGSPFSIEDVKKSCTIYENGKPQKTDSVDLKRVTRPIAPALVFDVSGSMNSRKNELYGQAIKDLLSKLSPQDKVVIEHFTSVIDSFLWEMADRPLSSYGSFSATFDQRLKDSVKTSYEDTPADEDINGALLGATRELNKMGPGYQKTIVLFTDGDNDRWSASKEAVIKKLEESGISIYVLFFEAPATRRLAARLPTLRAGVEMIDALGKLPQAQVIEFSDVEQIVKLNKEIAQQITQAHVLTYYPDSDRPVSRPKVEIRCQGAGVNVLQREVLKSN